MIKKIAHTLVDAAAQEHPFASVALKESVTEEGKVSIEFAAVCTINGSECLNEYAVEGRQDMPSSGAGENLRIHRILRPRTDECKYCEVNPDRIKREEKPSRLER